MKLPSFTKIYRKDTYPAIDPTRPELSAKGKTVIVTGAGIGGIGSEVALSFAKASAPKIALIGRTEKTLADTKSAIASAYPEADVFIAVADVSKAESVGRAAHDIRVALGAWDIFANFAAVLPPASTIAGADEDTWWQAFETTARFHSHFAKHFMPKARPNATFINANAGASHIPAARMPKNSAYSKPCNQRSSNLRDDSVRFPGLRLMIRGRCSKARSSETRRLFSCRASSSPGVHRSPRCC